MSAPREAEEATNDYGPGHDRDLDVEPLSAAEALTELMRRVDAIAKAEEHKSPGANFNFRGVDTVTNVIGPLLRDLGLIVLPEVIEHQSAMLEYGAKRTLGRFVTVLVRYRFVGPDGSDLIVGPIYGEAMDSGDKAGAKAMSVAYRTMWLQTLAVPTGDRDPDHDVYEVARPVAETTDPMEEAKLRKRIADAKTDATLRSAYEAVLAAYGGDKAVITAETRDELVALVKERKAAMDAAVQGGGQQG